MTHVGEFKVGDDGKSWIDLDMKVTGPNKESVLDQKNLLGEGGKTVLTNGYAESPYGVFSTTPQLPPGKYDVAVTIYDRLGEGSTSATKTVTLE